MIFFFFEKQSKNNIFALLLIPHLPIVRNITTFVGNIANYRALQYRFNYFTKPIFQFKIPKRLFESSSSNYRVYDLPSLHR